MAVSTGDKSVQAAKVPSPAAKVFAIPELLEAILLKLDDPSVRGDMWTMPVVDLFNCLRVNKTFNSTINGSKKLLQIMLLEFGKPDDEEGYNPPYGLNFLFHPFNPTTYSSSTNARIPKLLRIYPTMPSPGRGGNRTIHFDFQGYRDGIDCGADNPEYIAHDPADARHDPMGYDKEGREAAESILQDIMIRGHLFPQASWRRMRLESQPDSVHRVLIGLLTRNQPVWVEHEYAGITPFDDRVETLGDLFNLLCRVKQRPVSEHQRLRDIYHKVQPVVERGVHGWHDGASDCKAVKRLRILKEEHEELCSETVERATCAYCYCKVYEQGEDGELLTPESLGIHDR